MKIGYILQSLVRTRGSVVIKAAGKSMSPSLITGDEIMLAEIDNLSVGDLVSFLGPRCEMPVLHRLVWLHGDELIVMGDNEVCAITISRNALIGKCVAVWNDKTAKWADVNNSFYSHAIAKTSVWIFRSFSGEKPFSAKNIVINFCRKVREAACKKWRHDLLKR